MSAHLPPELMGPEERAARAEELRSQISGEWLRYGITEGIVIFLPVGLLGLLYAADAVSYAVLVGGAIVCAVASVPLITYWLLARILPLSRQLAALEN